MFTTLRYCYMFRGRLVRSALPLRLTSRLHSCSRVAGR